MKKTTMRMTVISAIMGAGLVLSACGGGAEGAGDDTAADQSDATTEEEPADSAADAPADAYTEDDLVAAVEAGGFTAQVSDASEASNEDIASMLGDATVEPAECEVFMNSAVAGMKGDDPILIVGTPADAEGAGMGSTGGATGFASAEEAQKTLDSNTDSLAKCSDITITTQGMEVNSSTSEVGASVDGADAVFASQMEMDVAGQTLTMTSVQALKGSAVFTATAGSGAGTDGPSTEELSATAADMIAALP